MSRAEPTRTHSPRLPDRVANYARDFLSALFMSLRTAQIHDPTNQAYQTALGRLHQSADALFATTGGFEMRIVDDSFFINGTRLQFDPGSSAAMRTLRSLLEAQKLGGFTIKSSPTAQGLLELVSLIANRRPSDTTPGSADLPQLDIALLGVQRVVDGASNQIDRGRFCLHIYAKLILAIRQNLRPASPNGTEDPPALEGTLRSVRVVQDLVEVVSERIDLLLRLATNTRGANVSELHGVNTCVLSVALGYSLGFHRRDLGDLGVAALNHHLGPALTPAARGLDLPTAVSMTRTLAETGIGRSLFTRAMILAEQTPDPAEPTPKRAHPFSRVVRVASTFSRLLLGYGTPNGERRMPIDALDALRRDHSGWLDPQVVDLLINLLRAYPPGAQVVLESGHYAIVSSPLNRRWDRPVVRVASRPPTSIDLMAQADGHFVNQVVATQAFLGAEPAQGQAMAAPPPQAVFDEAGRSSPLVPQAPLSFGSVVPPEPPGLDDLAVPKTIPPTEQSPVRGHPADQPRPARWPDADLPPAPVAPSVVPSTVTEGPLGPPSGPANASAPTQRPALGPAEGPPLPMTIPGEVGPSLPEPAPIQPFAPTDAPPPPRAVGPDRLLGTFLAGKYRILEKIGEGGMGTVFVANQEPIDRQVAVKVLHHSLANDEIAVRRFEREAKVISRMRHPNTVTVYDFGRTQAGELYLVMELLEGQTVAQLVRADGPLPGLRAARIIRQACGSLSEAHELGIIHRDLKPDNIFLTHYGEQRDFVKVLDFGLVKLADSDSFHRLTQQGKVYGTPRYMAPEQAEGRPIDNRSDIYTLGVVLYEMLTGRPLFTAETMVALLVKHIQTPPPPMGAVRPDLDVDPRLESIVMWALAKKAGDRPQSVVELARELERWEHESMNTPANRVDEPAAPDHGSAGGSETFAGSLDELLNDFLAELTPLSQLEDPESIPGAEENEEK